MIDEFLPNNVINNIIENFPVDKLDTDINFVGSYFEHNKRQTLPHACNQNALNYFLFFNSAPFLQFLEGITGIVGLIPDPYFSGGGFHEISKGGKLGIHADFRIQRRLHLNRRVNVLIYLNKDWQSAYGGELELWDKKMTKKIRAIEPLLNRCVIFNTDADSYHGHPEPLNTPNDSVTRKSIALYYYTASKSIYDETPNLSTQFQARMESEVFYVKKFNNKGLIKSIIKELLPPFISKSFKVIKRKISTL